MCVDGDEKRAVRQRGARARSTICRLALAGAAGGAMALAGASPALAGAPLGSVSELPVPTNNAAPNAVAAGPEGDIWFTEGSADKIGRVTPAGQFAEYAIPTPASEPAGIALGPDGNMWFTESKAGKIGRITPAGSIAEFALAAGRHPDGITAGPDGNVWFTDEAVEEILEGEKKKVVKAGLIGRITPAGAVSEWPIPTATGEPVGITTGPDGNVWFTEQAAGNIGRITPAGEIHEFHLNGGGGPQGIAPGANGEVWFTLRWGDKIGRIPPSGEPITETQLPPNSQPNEIALGPDGSLWFSENGPHKVIEGGEEVERELARIGRITPTEEIGEYQTAIPESEPVGLAAGPDAQLWFAEARRDNIGRIGTGAAEALLGAPAVSGNAQAGSAQTCAATWSSWASLQPSPSLFPFDGYTWLVDGAPVATGATYVPTTAQIGLALSCTEVVTYPLMNVTSGAASAPVTVLPPPPAVTRLHQSHARWRAGRALAQLSAAHGGRGRHRSRKRRKHRARTPVGTTFSFALNETAMVTFSFSQRLPGRRVGKSCLAKTRRRRRHVHPCTREVLAGTLPFSAHAGTDAVRFDGRISSSRRLKPGTYVLTVEATNVAHARSAPVSLTFTLVR
jgi:streptogramin lyase